MEPRIDLRHQDRPKGKLPDLRFPRQPTQVAASSSDRGATLQNACDDDRRLSFAQDGLRLLPGARTDPQHRPHGRHRRALIGYGVTMLNLRLDWRGQDGQDETQKPDHSASLGYSITSSTRMRFSVHTGVKDGIADGGRKTGSEPGFRSRDTRRGWYRQARDDKLDKAPS